MTEQNNDILFDLRDGIGRVTFNRPQARNAFTFQMYERVAEICEQANKDRGIKVLIFTGAGDKAFAAGTDINQFRAFSTPQDAIDYEARGDRVLGILEKLPRPDHRGDRRRLHRRRRRHRGLLRSAHRHQDRQIRFPDRAHARQLPVDGELRPPRGAARPRAREGRHLHGAPRRGAGGACASGLLSEVLEDVTALQSAGRRTREDACRACAADAARHQGSDAPPSAAPPAEEGHDLILMCYMSKDFREGLDAFLTKRTPQWAGE